MTIEYNTNPSEQDLNELKEWVQTRPVDWSAQPEIINQYVRVDPDTFQPYITVNGKNYTIEAMRDAN